MWLLPFACAPAPPSPDLPPAEATWQALDPLPVPLQETAVVAVGDAVWVIGGIDDALTPRAEVWVLGADGAWTAGPALPEPLHHVNAAVLDGRVHVLGALRGLSFDPVDLAWTSDGGPWEPMDAVPRPVGASAVGVADGRIVLAGGIAEDTTAASFSWDPAGGWTALPDLPGPLDHAIGAGGDRVRVLGGRERGLADVRSTVWALDGASWAADVALPTARAGAAGGVFPDGAIAVVGGEGDPSNPDGVFDEAELFDPSTGAWSALPPMPTPRHGMGAAPWNGGLVVPGGATVQGFFAVDTVEWLTRRP